MTMRQLIAAIITASLLLNPVAAIAVTLDADTRVYLADGSVVEGRMVQRSGDLVIMRVKDEIFTFDNAQIDRVIPLESLGGDAEIVTVREFPYISFLGGTAAFGLLAWIQFSNASDSDAEAQRNEDQVFSGDLQSGLLVARAAELRDDADRARLYGWGSTLVALGSMGVALYPRYTERRIFPQLSLDSQSAPKITLAYRRSF